MKISLLSLLIVCFTDTLSAQNNYTIHVTPLLSGEDTVIQKLKDDLKRNQLPYNGIPNSITTLPMPPVFLGNNGKGFDMYESRVDNMAILKPDNSFTSKMPVAGKITAHITPAFTIPRNKLDDVLEKIKNSDSLFMKPAKPKIYHYPKE